MTDDTLADLQRGRERFLALVADLRPDLHRYCARMTGSIADGEDIVQETLARAFYALSELEEMPQLRPWLFQIAHRRALDFLRRYDRRMGRTLDSVVDTLADAALDPADALAREEAVSAAVSRFVELAPAQRSCVVLKDVLGHSLEEISAILELSVPAVKAALHRGRERLRELPPPDEIRRPIAPEVARYAALFNARDWDGVRAMLAEDVRLDLVSRQQRRGREVSVYFTNYDVTRGWRVAASRLDGRDVVAVYRQEGSSRPDYFVELTIAAGRITAIRDFRYVPYIVQEATFEPLV